MTGTLEPIAPQADLSVRKNLRFRALEPRPVCAVFTTLPLQDYFGFFSRWRLRRRTPGPPPFSSMNSMPATSNARLMTSRSGSTRLTDSSLKLVHGYDAHARALGQFLLAPCKEAARGPALFWAITNDRLPRLIDSHNSIEIRSQTNDRIFMLMMFLYTGCAAANNQRTTFPRIVCLHRSTNGCRSD